jgi:hypothetical protein
MSDVNVNVNNGDPQPAEQPAQQPSEQPQGNPAPAPEQDAPGGQS